MTPSVLLHQIMKGALATALSLTAISAKSAISSTVVAWGVNSSGEIIVPTGLDGVTAIAAGYSHSVALKGDGTVVAWGGNGNGQTSVPVGLNGVASIAAGLDFTVALKNNGTVVAWGNNSSGRSTVPAGLNGVVAVAGGSYHTVALRSDGTVVTWGYNGSGQTTVPAGLSGVTAIAAGDSHSLALKSDGTLVAWGSQTSVPAGLSAVAAVAAGFSHSVALKTDGTLVAWGDNTYGQATVPTGLKDVRAISAGGNHSVALKNDGTVVGWGYNDNGETTVPTGLNGVIRIASGSYHTLAIGVMPPLITTQPASLTLNVTSNANFTVAATGAPLLSYQWRKNEVNVTGATNAALSLSNVLTNQAGNYTVIITNAQGSVTSSVAVLTVNRLVQTISFAAIPAKRVDGTPFSLSATSSGGLPVSYTSSNVRVATVSGNIITIKGVGGTTITATQSGNATFLPCSNVTQNFRVTGLPGMVIAWGHNYTGQTTGTPTPPPLFDFDYVTAVANPVILNSRALTDVGAILAGYAHSVALQSDGSVVAWGWNESGQTTDTPTPRVFPYKDPGTATANPVSLNGVIIREVTAIAAGRVYTVALRSDGSVVVWGAPSGNPPAGLTGVVAIAAGDGHTVALRDNGTVVGWGLNGFGQTSIPPT